MSKRPMRRRQVEAGFTLLEVLVATTIMAIAVAGSMSALSTTMRNASRINDYDRAAMLARRKMDEILIDQRLPKLATLAGTWDPSFTNGKVSGWTARVAPWEWPRGAGPGSQILERIELQVWWDDADKRRTFQLEGFRRSTLTAADIDSGALGPTQSGAAR